MDDEDSAIGRQLQHVGQGELLDALDKLAGRGLKNQVSYPQLVACGDQSCGKSSVLEALFHFRFPAKVNTTFAIEIQVRRHQSSGSNVSIIPGPSRNHNDKAKSEFAKFSSTHKCRSHEDIPQLIEAAEQTMKEASGEETSGIFDDILRIQVFKPEWPPMTVIDLPGLRDTDSQNHSLKDIQTIQRLTQEYMDDPRSIILAIVSPHRDIALQDVVSMAKSSDPETARTIGIITKPDIMQEHENLRDFNLLALNGLETHKLKLGWHILKNQNTSNQVPLEQDAAEKAFFTQQPWGSFEDQSSLGIDALRYRLSKTIHECITTCLPDTIDGIHTELSKTQSELAKLGKERKTRKAMEIYLIKLAQSFQGIVHSAVDGSSSDQLFFWSHSISGRSKKRLGAVIQDTNQLFSRLMATKGHSWQLKADNFAAESIFSEASIARTSFGDALKSEKFNDPALISRNQLLAKIKGLSQSSCSRADSNYHSVRELFREQSTAWQEVAEYHIKNVSRAVDMFIREALENLADDRSVNAIMFNLLYPILQTRTEMAKEKLNEILLPHRRLHPITFNVSLAKNIKEKKIKKEIERVSEEVRNIVSNQQLTFTPDELQALVSNLKIQPEREIANKFESSDILDYMEAYYETSMNSFINNVNTLVIENCLIAGLPDIFPPSNILEMDEETINLLASNSDEVQAKRKKVQARLDCLQESLVLCQKNLIYTPRPRMASKEVQADEFSMTEVGAEHSSLPETTVVPSSSPIKTRQQANATSSEETIVLKPISANTVPDKDNTTDTETETATPSEKLSPEPECPLTKSETPQNLSNSTASADQLFADSVTGKPVFGLPWSGNNPSKLQLGSMTGTLPFGGSAGLDSGGSPYKTLSGNSKSSSTLSPENILRSSTASTTPKLPIKPTNTSTTIPSFDAPLKTAVFQTASDTQPSAFGSTPSAKSLFGAAQGNSLAGTPTNTGSTKSPPGIQSVGGILAFGRPTTPSPFSFAANHSPIPPPTIPPSPFRFHN